MPNPKEGFEYLKKKVTQAFAILGVVLFFALFGSDGLKAVSYPFGSIYELLRNIASGVSGEERTLKICKVGIVCRDD